MHRSVAAALDNAAVDHVKRARLSKRVLRPGGVELTRTLLARADVANADVLELAPGLGRTATEILSRRPRSYLAAEADLDAANLVRNVVAGHGEVRVADAADTGLPDASSDVVIGEAMLTMQGDAAKHAVVAEAARVLRPHGRYAIHELALTPDDVSEEVSTDIRQSLARSIKVNARPLTVAELVAAAGRPRPDRRPRRDRADGAVRTPTSARRRRPVRRAAVRTEPARSP
jgi:SAM-dependent methyltransferase